MHVTVATTPSFGLPVNNIICLLCYPGTQRKNLSFEYYPMPTWTLNNNAQNFRPTITHHTSFLALNEDTLLSSFFYCFILLLLSIWQKIFTISQFFNFNNFYLAFQLQFRLLKSEIWFYLSLIWWMIFICLLMSFINQVEA